MKCEDVKEYLIEYIDGALGEEAKARVDEHLISCEECAKELTEIDTLFTKLDKIEPEQPSENMKKNFNNMINSYTLGMKNNSQISFSEKLSGWIGAWWPKKPMVQFSTTVAVLFVGLFVGLNINYQNKPDERIVQIKNDVDQLKQTVMTSLLNQSSVTDRINGLTMTGRLKNVDNQLYPTLFNLLNSDPNVNVRLAAVNALSRYAENQYVRNELVKSLNIQSSPLVQISLIDLLSSIQDMDSYPALMKMVDDPNIDTYVKKRAKSAITKLISYEGSIESL